MVQATAERQKKFRQTKRIENGVSERLDVWLSMSAATDLGALAARDGVSLQEALTQLLQQAMKPWKDTDFEGYMAACEAASKSSLKRATRGREPHYCKFASEDCVTR